MDGIEHLTPQKVEKVTCRLWKVSSSLNGLGSLFHFQSRESCIDQDEYAGIGHLLQEMSKEITRLEDILRCGYDSVTKGEIERNYADDVDDDDEPEEENLKPGPETKSLSSAILKVLNEYKTSMDSNDEEESPI